MGPRLLASPSVWAGVGAKFPCPQQATQAPPRQQGPLLLAHDGLRLAREGGFAFAFALPFRVPRMRMQLLRSRSVGLGALVLLGVTWGIERLRLLPLLLRCRLPSLLLIWSSNYPEHQV